MRHDLPHQHDDSADNQDGRDDTANGKVSELEAFKVSLMALAAAYACDDRQTHPDGIQCVANVQP